MNYNYQNPLQNMASEQKQQLLNNQVTYDNNINSNNTPYPDFSQYTPNTNTNNNYNQEIYVHNSLNEPILTSLTRDLNRIYSKLKVVALPVASEAKNKELKQWDLWGPFIICLLLGIILCFTSKKNSGLVFSMIFIIMWIGAMIITMNSSLLGGKLTLMQCICLLGYCTFPSVVAAFFNRVILEFLPSIGKLIIVFISFVWSTKGKYYFNIIFYFINIIASVPFISENINPKKRLLAVYPVMLYFLYLNYFILV